MNAESARTSSTRRRERSAARAVTVPVGFSMLVGAQGPCWVDLHMAMNAHLVTLRVTDGSLHQPPSSWKVGNKLLFLNCK